MILCMKKYLGCSEWVARTTRRGQVRRHGQKGEHRLPSGVADG